jgi:ribose transport system permease protein
MESKLGKNFAGIFKKGILRQSNIISLLFVWIFIVVLFYLLNPYFFSLVNFMNIGRSVSLIGISGAGFTTALIAGSVDISIASVMAATGMVVGILYDFGVPIGIAILAGLALGVIAGYINGTIITKLKVNSLIATLGTLSIFRGFAFISKAGRSIIISERSLDYIGRGVLSFIPMPFLILILVFILVHIFLSQTDYGRTIYAIGGNSEASRLAGINVMRLQSAVHIISSFLAAISGIVLTGLTGSALPTAGSGLEFEVIAAVVLGGVSLSGGTGSMLGVFLGILILGTLGNGLVIMGISSYWQQVARGVVLIVAVAVDQIRIRAQR